MQSFIDIIDAWKSRQDLAEDIGVKRTLVNVWRHRGSIPPPYWLKVAQAAQRRGIDGVTLESLAALGEAFEAECRARAAQHAAE